MKKSIIIKAELFTEKVKRLIYDKPKYELADELGISRVTLDNRLKTHNWTYIEYLIINELCSKLNIK